MTFHSDIAGDVIVPWDKIKSIQSSQQFAVIEQGQHVSRKTPDADVAQGTVQIQNDEVKVTPATGGTSKDISVKNAQYIIDEATYGSHHRRSDAGRGHAEQPRLYRFSSLGEGGSRRDLA